MPGKPRLQLPGLPQHVIQRGNNRGRCFYRTAEYRCYLRTPGEALLQEECRLHACVPMTNHVHPLVAPGVNGGIARLMQAVGRNYVRYINRTYPRSGTLWEGRYQASLVDSDAWLLTCMRYIEMHPVRAGRVDHPAAYRWSSYRAYAHGLNNALLTRHGLYPGLGRDTADRQSGCRGLFRGGLRHDELHEIRETLNQERVPGREGSRDRIAGMTRRQVRRGRDGRPPLEEAGE